VAWQDVGIQVVRRVNLGVGRLVRAGRGTLVGQSRDVAERSKVDGKGLQVRMGRHSLYDAYARGFGTCPLAYQRLKTC